MMTKTRSGIPAKLKAMLVIPFAIIAFLLFAEFTVKGPGNRAFDLTSAIAELPADADMNGLWVSKSAEGFSKLVHFSDEMFSYKEGDDVSEYFWRMEKGELILSGQKGAAGIHLKAKITGEELVIWWNDLKGIQYSKTGADNTMDFYLQSLGMKMQLPYISQFRLMENESLYYKICLTPAKDGSIIMFFEGKKAAIGDLEDLVVKFRAKHSTMNVNKLTALFYADKYVPMKEVLKVKEELRRIGSLKFADAGYPVDAESISPLLFHTVALPRLLPPMDAKIVEKEELFFKGIKLFVIDLSARNTTPRDLEENLTEFIRENSEGKYVFSLEYDDAIPYGQYLESVDLIFNVVYSFRKELALKKYKIPYADLGPDLQKEIKKAYPMVLSEAWNK